jgi:hypothetical protein
MVFQNKYNKFMSSRDYAYARKLRSSIPMPEEQKLKIGIACKGRKLTIEQKLRISQVHKGKKVSKESIEKRKLMMKDYKPSEETKKN